MEGGKSDMVRWENDEGQDIYGREQRGTNAGDECNAYADEAKDCKC